MGEWGRRRVGGAQLTDSFRKLLCAALLLVAGCTGVPGREPTGDIGSPIATDGGDGPTTSPDHPALESVLVQLLDAENRSAFAADKGLRLRGDRVLVVIKLRADRQLPDGYDVGVEARHDGLVQAYVGFDDLRPLAAHRNVSFVRTPREPIQHETTTQ